MEVLTSKHIKDLEDLAFDRGLSYELMMETAGINAARLIDEQNKNQSLKIAVVCGKGKNGGDGFVLSDWLYKNTKNKISLILALGEPVDDISKSMLARLEGSKVKIVRYQEDKEKALEYIKEADIIVDAIFGIGMIGQVYGDAKTIIEKINQAGSCVYSLDLPSGILSDKNTLPACYVRADHTITMLRPKPALALKPTSKVCGKISLAGIGIDEDLIRNVKPAFYVLSKEELRAKFSPRPYDSHKGTFGTVLSICGSYKMPGAAVLAARACVSSGAGLVRVAFPSLAYPAISPQLTEPVLMPLKSNPDGRICKSEAESLIKEAKKSSVVLLGCGLGLDEDIKEIASKIIKNVDCPLIIDADGINALSLNINLLKEAKGDIILTPHPGEMSRLTGLSIEEINANRLDIAKKYAKKWRLTLLLKGENTIIASADGKCFVNPTGSPALARGGSGDVLSGMIAAFISQGMNPFDASLVSAFLHGYVAEKFGQNFAEISFTPTMLINGLPFALSALLDA